LELKGKLNKSAFHLAKWVASFANSSGGTVLVGAAEDTTKGVVGKYLPLTKREAHMTVESFDTAIKDRCSPRPFYTRERIPIDGGMVVAINVWPFPAQVVGVRVDAAEAEGYKGSAYVFPVRAGAHTPHLLPEQLAMLMIPELRRVVILLSALKEGQEVTVHQVEAAHTPQSSPPLNVRFGRSDALSNILELTQETARQGHHTIRIPLDRVVTVYEDFLSWKIVVRGRMVDSHDGHRFEP